MRGPAGIAGTSLVDQCRSCCGAAVDSVGVPDMMHKSQEAEFRLLKDCKERGTFFAAVVADICHGVLQQNLTAPTIFG